MPYPVDPKHPSPEGSAWAFDQVEAFLDGDLTPADAERFQAALDTDDSLARELDDARRCREALRGLPARHCPPELTRAILAGAAATEAPPLRLIKTGTANEAPAEPRSSSANDARRPFAWRPGWLAAAAAGLIAVIATSSLVFSPGSSQPSPEEVAQAELEVKLAFAYLGKVSGKAGMVVGEEVMDNVISPTRQLLGIAGAQEDAP